MNLEERLAQLRVKHDKERREAEQEYAAVTALGELGEYPSPQVCVYPLWGTAGSFIFRQDNRILGMGKNPDAGLLRELLVRFPPRPLVKDKSGFVSFRPREEIDENGVSFDEVTPIGPMLVQVKTAWGVTSLEWYSPLPPRLGVWRFALEFPRDLCNQFGKLDLRYKRGGKSAAVCDFTPADGMGVVKWASGDRKTPNDFTVYWRDLTVDAVGKAVEGVRSWEEK